MRKAHSQCLDSHEASVRSLDARCFGCGLQLLQRAILSIWHVPLTRHAKKKSQIDQEVAFFFAITFEKRYIDRRRRLLTNSVH